VFYRLKGTAAVASHCTLLAELFGDGPDPLAVAIREDEAFRHRMIKYLPGDLSAHNNIKALPPNHYYDIKRRHIVRYWPRHKRKSSSIKDFYGKADAYFDAFADFLRSGFSPILSITAGIDSRCLIAALRPRGVRMRFVTWIDYSFPKHDRPVTEAVASYVGDHIFLRGGKKRDDELFLRIADAAALNASHFRNESFIPSNMRRRFPGERHVFVRGHGGEIMRGFYSLHRRPIKTTSVAELVRVYNKSKVEPSAQYIGLLSQAVEHFMLRANYAELHTYGFDINDIYYWEQRMGMWGSAVQNEMDAGMLSFTGYNSRLLFESALGLEPCERLTKSLQISLTRRYDPQLAEIPVN
jgi:hypothetical protein